MRVHVSPGGYSEGCCSGVVIEVTDMSAADREGQLRAVLREDIISEGEGIAGYREFVINTHYGDNERLTLVPFGRQTIELSRAEVDEEAERIADSFRFMESGLGGK